MIQFFQITKFLSVEQRKLTTPSKKDHWHSIERLFFISAEQCLDVMPPNISSSHISVLLQSFKYNQRRLRA